MEILRWLLYSNNNSERPDVNPGKPSANRNGRCAVPVALLGAVVLMLILTLMIGLSYETSTRFRQIEEGWQEYSKDADPRGIWIS